MAMAGFETMHLPSVSTAVTPTAFFVHRPTRRLALAAWEARMAARCRKRCMVTFEPMLATPGPCSIRLSHALTSSRSSQSIHQSISPSVRSVSSSLPPPAPAPASNCCSRSLPRSLSAGIEPSRPIWLHDSPHSCTASRARAAIESLQEPERTAIGRQTRSMRSLVLQAQLLGATCSDLSVGLVEGLSVSQDPGRGFRRSGTGTTGQQGSSTGLPKPSGGMKCTGRFRSRGVRERKRLRRRAPRARAERERRKNSPTPNPQSPIPKSTTSNHHQKRQRTFHPQNPAPAKSPASDDCSEHFSRRKPALPLGFWQLRPAACDLQPATLLSLGC